MMRRAHGLCGCEDEGLGGAGACPGDRGAGGAGAGVPFVIERGVCDARVVLPGPAAGISMMGRGHGRHDGPSGKEGGHGE